MRACVIFNPAAKGDKARRFRRQLDAIARQATLASTQKAGDARQLSAQAVRDGFDTIIAAGGDGTLNEVLNGIGDAQGFDRCRLGVLPLGTINVFARELGISSDLDSAWKTIITGHSKVVDLPAATYLSNGSCQKRYFAQLAGAGFDARAIELTDWSLKKKIGPLAYVAAGLKCMVTSRCRVRAEMEGLQKEGELILIGNGRLYGGDYPVFHNADLNDGLLDVAVFPKVNWLVLANCGPSLLMGRRLPEAAALHFKARSLTMKADCAASFQLDGELVGQLPVDFSIQRDGLTVLAP